LFLFGQGIFTKGLSGSIHLGCLCKEDLFLYPFLLFFCQVIPSVRRFIKATIRKFLLAFSKQEGAGSSMERQSLFTLLELLHFKGDLKVF
jgi:hypothetical protein